ncbi:HK97-gp10 family putative phage morphogenesis protein [Brucellaceae bacterium D45D]
MARSKDLQGLINALNAIPKQVRAKIDPAIEKGADEMTARMRLLVPDDPKTGGNDLKASIKKVDTGVPMAIRVQAIDENPKDGFDVALGQEYGTEKMAAQPFFWPSVNTTKKRVRRRIDRAISKAVGEAFKK